MQNEGPPLEVLLHRLTNCPADLHQHAGRSRELTLALMADYFRLFDAQARPSAELSRLSSGSAKLTSMWPIIIWLLRESWLLEHPPAQPALLTMLLHQRLERLAEMVSTETLVGDPDRREELVRLVLALLDLRPRGETLAQATDRLTTLDSVERKRILQATLAAEKRAKEVREAMARARAQEAASRYSE